MVYEMLYIISSAFTDTEIDSVKEKVAEMIKKAGGDIKRHEKIAKLALSYPIKKQKHGTYVLAYFTLQDGDLKKLDRELQLEDDLLRHMIVSVTETQMEAVFELAPYVYPLADKPVPDRPRAPRPTPIAPPPPAVPQEKMSVEEIDKKLDEILEDDKLTNV